MTLAAFTHTAAGLFKIYDHGQDFQIVGPGFERWRSKWAADPAASLKHAAETIPHADPAAITYTQQDTQP